MQEADVIADLSGCDGSTDNLETPHILVAHGRPRHSFLSEVNGGAPIYSYWHRLNRTPKYKAVVTFWPQHVGHLQSMFKDKPVACVPSPVDLQAWNDKGPSGYGFHGHKGEYNLVISDAWRDDADPFNCLTLAILVGRLLPIKLHIYGKGETGKGWAALLNQAKEEGILGEVEGRIQGLDNVYRAADLVLSCNEIDTRTVREAMACGCPVWNVPPTGLEGWAANLAQELKTPRRSRAMIRQEAEKRFDPLNTAKAFGK